MFLLLTNRDIDSDGEEMSKAFNEEKHQQFTLWFSFDLKVSPQAAQSLIELEAHTLVEHFFIGFLFHAMAKE